LAYRLNAVADAFSPRVGIVYQPIEPVSLYASYTRSFTPESGTDASGDPFEPRRGNGYEVGVLNIPTEPDGVYRVNKKFPQEREAWGRSQVFLDHYTGEVLRVKDVRSLSRGEVVLDAFTPLHYGTFGGLPTRILYVFIGLSCIAIVVKVPL
jgi:hypothetical protein